VQPLLVINRRDEMVEVSFGLGKRLIVVEVDLLTFKRLEETLGPGILVGIADSRHAELAARRLQPGDVGLAGIVHPLIGMMMAFEEILFHKEAPNCMLPGV